MTPSFRPDAFQFRRRAAQSTPTINVVPLVDVLLVLLVILLVTAPALVHVVTTQLPRAVAAPAQRNEHRLILTIAASGVVFWGEEAVPLDALQARLSEALQNHQDTELLIQAHRDVAFERVAQVMAAAARAGLKRVGFAVQPS